MSKEIDKLKGARRGLLGAVVTGVVVAGNLLLKKPGEKEGPDILVRIGKYVLGKEK